VKVVKKFWKQPFARNRVTGKVKALIGMHLGWLRPGLQSFSGYKIRVTSGPLVSRAQERERERSSRARARVWAGARVRHSRSVVPPQPPSSNGKTETA
jgi:hypothetical protein